LVPLRIVLIILLNILGSLIFKIFGTINSTNKNTSTDGWKKFEWAANLIGMMNLFCFGIYSIENIKVNLPYIKKSNKNCAL